MSREKGTVSLTQIKELAKDLNSGYPITLKYRGSKLVYGINRGWGWVRIVSVGYKLKDGEQVIADEEGLRTLSFGFYNLNCSPFILEPSLQYLYKEVNKRVYVLENVRIPKEEVKVLYAKYKGFKEFYQKVESLPKNFYVDYTDYDFMTADMYRANRRVTEYLKKLGKENNLVVEALGDPDGYYMRYEIEGYDSKSKNPTAVYFSELSKFVVKKNLDDKKSCILTDLLTYLYRVDKEDFMEVLASNNGYPYIGLVKEFTKQLEQGMKEINIEGLTNWYAGAIKLRANKETIKGLGSIRGN